jgi:hypothetical protein
MKYFIAGCLSHCHTPDMMEHSRYLINRCGIKAGRRVSSVHCAVLNLCSAYQEFSNMPALQRRQVPELLLSIFKLFILPHLLPISALSPLFELHTQCSASWPPCLPLAAARVRA